LTIAQDPYAAARFFRFTITNILEILYGIDATGPRIKREVGILGLVNAYIGVVEAQNRGTLHLHLIIWIKSTIRAHLPGLETEAALNAMPVEPDLAYNRPPNTSKENFWEEFRDCERRLMRSHQLHNHGFINNYNPPTPVVVKCNQDIKLLTSGTDTNNISWYITKYSTKAQQHLSNTSALLAKGLQYHFNDDKYIDNIRDRSRLLMFRCLHVLCSAVPIRSHGILDANVPRALNPYQRRR